MERRTAAKEKESEGLLMEIKRHMASTETPQEEITALLLIEVSGTYIWTVGSWTERGWDCSYNEIGYAVIEWYELPQRKKIKEDYSYRQMRLEEFWGDK